MGNGFQFLDIIFFALIAGFIILRLRSVLGKRTGHEQRDADPFRARRASGPEPQPAELGADNVIALPGQNGGAVAADSPLGAGLTQIRVADPRFDAADFLEKAKAAFEYIVTGFAAGEASKLKPLLSREVFDGFATAIRERERKGETLETTIVRLKEAELVEAGMEGRTASITVKYVSEQINVTRDAKGEAVAGDPNRITETVDIWTYERNTRSSDPNWLLVATETPE